MKKVFAKKSGSVLEKSCFRNERGFLMMSKQDSWLMDRRIIKRHITNNLLTEKELKSYLASLKDSSSSAEEIDINEIESFQILDKS